MTVAQTVLVKILVVIPVYNHAATLKSLVDQVLAVCRPLKLPLLVVDDGCTDGGPDLLDLSEVTLIRHPQNRGKGGAVISAIQYARRHQFTHIITLDADGQHSPGEIPLFIEAIYQDPEAMIVGYRDFKTTSVHFGSRFGRQFSNFWLRFQTGISLGDSQSGFRAYPVDVVSRLKLKETGFAFEIEVLVQAAWAGVVLCDVPISVYYPKQGRRSHFNQWRDNARLAWLNTRLTLRCFLPIPHRRLYPDKHQAPISIRYPLQSLRRLLIDANQTPVRLSLASAWGIVIGALPIFGFHTMLILFTAKYMRLSPLMSVVASQVCMPPIVPALCIEIGYFLRHGVFLTEISIRTLGYQGFERLLEWLLGSLLLGPILGILIGLLVFLSAAILDNDPVAPHADKR